MIRLVPLPLLLALAAPAFAQTLPYDLSDTPKVTPVAATKAKPKAPAAASKSAFDQPETREMAENRADGMFKLMDADHDGFLTREEVTAFFAKQAELRGQKLRSDPPIIAAMFDDADTDHDGKISAEEAKAAADRGFDEADTNHDGVVTPDERRAAMRDVVGPGAAPVKGKPQESGR